MKYGSLVGWGVVIYAVTALSWQAIAMYGLAFSPLALVLQILALTIVTTAASRIEKLTLWPDVIPHSLTWAGVNLALDVIFKVPPLGWIFFFNWTVWVWYALIVIIPAITVQKPQLSSMHK